MERVMAVLAVSAAQEKVVGNVWARAVFCVRRGGGRRRLRRLWLPVGHEQVSARFAVQWRMRQRRSEVEASTDAAGTGGSLRALGRRPCRLWHARTPWTSAG